MPDTHAEQDFLGYRLRRLADIVESGFAKKLKPYRLTVTQWIILRWLRESEEIKFGEVVSFIGLDRAVVSKVCASLRDRKLIQYRVSIEDKRLRYLKLTSKGQTLVDTIVKLATNNDKEMFSTLTHEQRKDLNKLVNKLLLDVSEDFRLLEKW